MPLILVDMFQKIIEPLPIRGKGRLAAALLARTRRKEVTCHPLPNVTIFLRPGVWIEQLMWAGAYEPALVSLLKLLLKPGMTVLDVGANIGYFSAISATLVGPSGRVYSFEPMTECFMRLQQNVKAYPWAQAQALAISDEPGMAVFHFSERSNESGWGTLLANGDLSHQRVNVNVMTLDDWVRQASTARVDFIKVDIEGGEYRAIAGAKRLLSEFRPIVVAELNDKCLARDDRRPQDVIDLLHKARYDAFSFNDGVLGIPNELSSQIVELSKFTTMRLD
jgi:FkbM family methyltransferase